MRYIIITEDGQAFVSTTMTDDDMEACDAGILEVIDTQMHPISNYYEGKWHKLEVWNK